MIIGVSPSFEDHCAGNKDPETDGDPSEQTHNWKGPSIKVWVFLWGWAVKLASPCLSPWKLTQLTKSRTHTQTHTQRCDGKSNAFKCTFHLLEVEKGKEKNDCATSCGWTPSGKWCLKSSHPPLPACHILRGRRRQAATRLSQANMSASAGNCRHLFEFCAAPPAGVWRFGGALQLTN